MDTPAAQRSHSSRTPDTSGSNPIALKQSESCKTSRTLRTRQLRQDAENPDSLQHTWFRSRRQIRAYLYQLSILRTTDRSLRTPQYDNITTLSISMRRMEELKRNSRGLRSCQIAKHELYSDESNQATRAADGHSFGTLLGRHHAEKDKQGISVSQRPGRPSHTNRAADLSSALSTNGII